jgi:type IV fimbrial biogenesis protein FimT
MKGSAFQKNRRNGFTLLELLMVVLIISIITAMAIPGFGVWLPNYRLKSAARDVFSNFQLAKLSAVKQNRAWAVIFDAGESPGRYFLCSDDGGDGWDGPDFIGGNDTVEKIVDLANYGNDIAFGHGDATDNATTGGGSFPDDDISYTTPENTAIFSPGGTISNLGYVYLSNDRGQAFAIGTPSTAGVIVIRRWTNTGWR